MVGILASMAAGFAAGGAKSYGDVVDDRIKTKLDLAKEAALEARMKNMMELQQKYQTRERLASQEFQTRNEADKKAQDQNLVNYMAGVSEVGGDEYSVPIDKNDFKKGMSADGILAVKSLESAEEKQKYDRQFKEKEFNAETEYKKKYLDVLADNKANSLTKAQTEAQQKMLNAAGKYAIDRIDKDVENGIEYSKEAKALKMDEYKREYLSLVEGVGGEAEKTTNQVDLAQFYKDGKGVGGNPTSQSTTPTKANTAPKAILDPKDIERSPKKYTDAKIIDNYIWATDPDGKARRLFKVETPETKYGEKTYPNKNYQEYLKKIESLGIK